LAEESRFSSRFPEAVILLAIFLDLFGFGMLIPDIQFRAERLGMTGWEIGAALTTTFVIQFVVSPLWGRASDRLGRKPILLACAALSASGLFTYGIATLPIVIVISRVLSGFGGANVSIAQAYMADRSTSAGRTGAMGRIGAAVSAGLIAGPASLSLPALRHINVGLTAGMLSAAGVVALLFLPAGAPVTTGEPERKPIFDFSLLRTLPALRSLVIVAAVAWFSLAMLEGTFGRLIERTLGFHRLEFGRVFALEAVVGVVAQGLILAWLAKRTRPDPRLRISYLLQGAGLALTPYVLNLPSLFGVSALYALGSAVANGTVNGLCSLATPEDRQGELFGLLQGARSVGFAIGPILGGIVFDLRPQAPYLLAGGTCLAAAILVRLPRVPT